MDRYSCKLVANVRLISAKLEMDPKVMLSSFTCNLRCAADPTFSTAPVDCAAWIFDETYI